MHAAMSLINIYQITFHSISTRLISLAATSVFTDSDPSLEPIFSAAYPRTSRRQAPLVAILARWASVRTEMQP